MAVDWEGRRGDDDDNRRAREEERKCELRHFKIHQRLNDEGWIGSEKQIDLLLVVRILLEKRKMCK